jgi:CheY-like chemotaxis protein/putative hemolysin
MAGKQYGSKEVKDKFLDLIGHELREPLAPIMASLSILLGRANSSDEDELEIIRRNIQVQANIIDDMLDLSRIVNKTLKIRFTPLDIEGCLANVMTHLRSKASEKGIMLIPQFHAQSHVVLGDEKRLKKAICHVLLNAIECGKTGGQIVIETSNHAGRVLVCTEDDGRGFTKDELRTIFYPFNGSGEGIGVGLAIANGIIEKHDGTLTAVSKGKGKGSRFTMSLGASTEIPLQIAISNPSGTSKRAINLLLIEDHPDTRAAMIKVLTTMGFGINAVTSLSAAREYIHNDLPCDLVISDIGLPDGSGLDIMPFLNEHNKKAIALSGYGADYDIASSVDAGFAYHFVKPVDLDALKKAIETLV